VPDDALEPLLDTAGIDPAHVGPEEMIRLGAQVTGSVDDFILYATRAPGLMSDQERPPEYFEIHDREWWINARVPAAREFLITLVAAAAIGDALRLDHTVRWLTKVLPATLTVTGVTAAGGKVHFTIARQHAPRLPPELADDIHPHDFTAFTAALADAAETVRLSSGGTVTFVDE
jgi:hypothetical protein